MKTKRVSYDLDNDLMLLKCLGCYRVWVSDKKTHNVVFVAAVQILQLTGFTPFLKFS